MFTLVAGRPRASGEEPVVTSTPESMAVTIDADGRVTVNLPFPSSGQGHETYVAQLLSDELGIDMREIVVHRLDTNISPPSVGPAASRLASTLAELVHLTALKVKQKLTLVASHLMEARLEDLVYEGGLVKVRGAPGRNLSFKVLCDVINMRTHKLPNSIEAGLNFITTTDFRPGLPDEKMRLNRYNTMSSSSNLALVEVDVDTGRVKPIEYWVVHDCGTIVNTLSVDGQVIGGVAQGIEQALFGEFVYDENGQLLNPTLMDYLLPTAADLIRVRLSHIETPSPHTHLGIKGVGEGGILWAPSAMLNAVEDALQDLSVEVNEIPVTPERLYRRIRNRS
jgi:carbon-monoxide dehydrogenase large subunit